MNEFPQMLYRAGGMAVFDGVSVDYMTVAYEEARDIAMADGWVATVAEVMAGATVVSVDDDAPPTRAELEQQANALGLKFDGRTTDRKLAAMIEAAQG